MDTCPNCGVRVTPDLTWCGQCLQALPRRTAPWMQHRPTDEPKHVAVFSRWQGGPTWFGPVGRVLMTIALLAGLVAGAPLFRGFLLVSIGFDIPAAGALALYLAVAVPGGIFLLTRVWKRARVA